MTEIICSKKDKCTDYPIRCNTCSHNKGKKSHYEPDHPIAYPPPWKYPFWFRDGWKPKPWKLLILKEKWSRC